MSEDRYARFLGLPAGPRPPMSHVLLGVEPDVNDPAVIEMAVQRRMDQLDQYALSNERATREQVQKLMNEVAKARVQLVERAEARARKAKQSEVPRPTPKPEAPKVTPQPKPPHATETTRRVWFQRPRLAAEAWSLIGVAWLGSLVLTAAVAYMLGLPEPTPTTVAVVPDIPTEVPVDAAESTEPPADPAPPPVAIPAVTSLDEVMQIEDHDVRLAAFIRLRDSINSFNEQAEVIRQALLAFNKTDQVNLSANLYAGGKRGLHLIPERGGTNWNANLTDLSVFTGMKLNNFTLKECDHIRDFSVLKTMEINSLRVDGCDGFTNVDVLNHIKGLNSVAMLDSRVPDLRPLKLERLSFFGIGSNRLRSLDGLEDIAIANFGVSGAPNLNDFSALKSMTISSRLDLSGTGFSDMSLLTNKTFTRLVLNNCESLRSLRGVETMARLDRLEVQGTSVPDVEVDRIQELIKSGELSAAFDKPDAPKPAANLKAKTLVEVMRIEDRDARLDAFIKLRDSLDNDFDAQVGLIRQALVVFNGNAEIEMQHGTTNRGERYIRLIDQEQGDLKIKDISVFKGIKLHSLQLSNCEDVEDFSMLKSINVATLSLSGCTQFNDLSLLDGMDGLTTLGLSKTGLKDLKGLKPRKLKHLTLSGCRQLQSLDGIEGMDIQFLTLNNTSVLTDISALREATVAHNIIFSYTPIQDLSAISHMRISQLTLYYLPKLKSLEVVNQLPAIRTLGFRSHRDNPLGEQVDWLKEQRPSLNIR